MALASLGRKLSFSKRNPAAPPVEFAFTLTAHKVSGLESLGLLEGVSLQVTHDEQQAYRVAALSSSSPIYLDTATFEEPLDFDMSLEPAKKPAKGKATSSSPFSRQLVRLSLLSAVMRASTVGGTPPGKKKRPLELAGVDIDTTLFASPQSAPATRKNLRIPLHPSTQLAPCFRSGDRPPIELHASITVTRVDTLRHRADSAAPAAALAPKLAAPTAAPPAPAQSLSHASPLGTSAPAAKPETPTHTGTPTATPSETPESGSMKTPSESQPLEPSPAALPQSPLVDPSLLRQRAGLASQEPVLTETLLAKPSAESAADRITRLLGKSPDRDRLQRTANTQPAAAPSAATTSGAVQSAGAFPLPHARAAASVFNGMAAGAFGRRTLRPKPRAWRWLRWKRAR